MTHVLTSVLFESWHILNESAPYVLFGFLMAALAKAFIPEGFVAKHLGKSNTSSVLKASLLGVPLPLCSCGVIPAAIGLRKQGASKGSTTAFLISTPESGADSVAITWALLDPIMTVVRPLAAFFTASVAGFLVNALPEPTTPENTRETKKSEGTCGCKGSCSVGEQTSGRSTLLVRLKEGFIYAFGGLIGDVGGWLLIGIGIAAVISFAMPADLLGHYTKNEFVSLVSMLLLGIPLYVCATASTPIAAALVLKGLSPGAALVFLLAGPATNATTITVVTRLLGKRIALLYVGTISGCSLLIGWVVDQIYTSFHIDSHRWVHAAGETAGTPLAVVASILFLILVVSNSILTWNNKKEACGCGGSH